ncbi:hypothetical protein STCU_09991 [Strigomonas culicis]|uniref:Elongation of fatty acids protein n=1 Tax=Strigomonas culicis TaxID=28005 RepID=S9TNY3_9TRYP|nr:hypothetical protein STCU_09991 [Strigomonas culicis]|eukprot:EPY18414.1 hypothetical protein STCU_09991 [Strigomonas culicis]
MSWFHHVTIFLYSWYAYQQKSTIFIIIASMNYPVHTIMYLYFAFSEFGLARFVKPFAKYITIMQICQMIGGITMTAIAQYHKWQDDVHDACPGATWAMCRGQNMIYIANLYLFSEMFLNAYVWKKVEAKKDRKAQ